MSSFFQECTANLPEPSSGEEDNARAKSQRHVVRTVRRKPSQAMHKRQKIGPRESDATAEFKVPTDKIEPLAALVANDPKICIATKQQLAAASAGANGEQPLQPAPTLEKLLEAKMQLLGDVDIAQQVFEQPIDKKMAVRGLRNGTATLHAVPCGVESALLGEAGTFRIADLQGASRTFPACRNGAAKCQMNKYYGHIGRSWMTLEEFEAFCKRNETPPQRICIICHRVVVEDLVCTINSEEGGVCIDEQTALVQQYCNLIECPGGYQQQYARLHPADDGIYRGVFGPVVVFQQCHLLPFEDDRQINEATGKPAWMLRQDKIVWQSVQQQVLPELGESARDFQSGAVPPPQLLTS